MDYLRQRRIVYIFIFFNLLFLPLLIHLASIQVFQGPEYAVRAQKQQTQQISLERVWGEKSLGKAERGNIYDTGMIPLTDPGYQYYLAVFPGLVKDKNSSALGLTSLLGVEQELIRPYLMGSPAILPFSLATSKVELARELDLPGFQAVPVYLRYGQQALARHVVGNLGKISNQDSLSNLNYSDTKSYHLSDLIGKQGLELLYEKELKGTKPEKSLSVFVDATGSLIPGLGYRLNLEDKDPQRQNIVLTINYHIQKTVEKIMDESVKEGAVVVMDVKTGDLLALASRPNYDQNMVGQYLPRKDKALLDHTTLLYQPGSVFKVIVAAAALEVGLVSPQTQFICLGEKDKFISFDGANGHGQLDFSKALAVSCNSTFARVGLALGPDHLIEYAQKFGLANQEIIGYKYLYDQRQDWSRLKKPNSMVNSSIGQGDILATPVQITAMMNVAATGGYYRQPRLVKELQTSTGIITRRFQAATAKRVIAPTTARTLGEMLQRVTTEGTGRAGYVAEFGSSGKTGTAQVNKSKGISNAWFSGYAPVEDPRYVITVLVEEGKSGGETAAPIFQQIMTKILQDDN